MLLIRRDVWSPTEDKLQLALWLTSHGTSGYAPATAQYLHVTRSVGKYSVRYEASYNPSLAFSDVVRATVPKLSYGPMPGASPQGCQRSGDGKKRTSEARAERA